MRRRTPQAPSTFFRGRERSRFMLMIALLVVLFMLIQRARQLDAWKWLADGEPTAPEEVDFKASKPKSAIGKPPADEPSVAKSSEATSGEVPAQVTPSDKAPPPSDAAAPAKTNDENKSNVETPVPTSQGEITPEPLPKSDVKEAGFYDKFPPDEDEFEQELLAKNLQTVGGRDKALGLNKLEMPAYWQLLRWAHLQSPEAMAKRKTMRLTYDMMIRKTEEHRGALVRLNVNVRRVVKQPAEKGNPLGVDHVYEMIGFNDESQSWLMYCIVPELPPGMPVGTVVNERVSFVGYFLKVQGYQRSEVTPEERFYHAPLFLGRVVWQARDPKPPEEPTWMWWVLGGAAVTMVAAIGGWIFRPQPKPLVHSSADEANRQADLEAFLSRKPEPWESLADDDDDPADAWKKPPRPD